MMEKQSVLRPEKMPKYLLIVLLNQRVYLILLDQSDQGMCNRLKETRSCATCGNDFLINGSSNRLNCSSLCSRSYHKNRINYKYTPGQPRKLIQKETRVCVTCGNDFLMKCGSNRLNCSMLCTKNFHKSGHYKEYRQRPWYKESQRKYRENPGNREKARIYSKKQRQLRKQNKLQSLGVGN